MAGIKGVTGRKKDPVRTAQTREDLLRASYSLFSRKGIESVSMEEAAKAAGYGVATLYRYYGTKPKLVVAVASWKWSEFLTADREERHRRNVPGMSAAERYGVFLDTFIKLYRNNKDLLRFNQFFNLYIGSAKIDAETLGPYSRLLGGLEGEFFDIYAKAQTDRTLRTDVPKEIMFSTTLHLMMAAATRYAAGLVYRTGGETDEMNELNTLKNALLREYTAE